MLVDSYRYRRKKRRFPLIRLFCLSVFGLYAVKTLLLHPASKTEAVQHASIVPELNSYSVPGQKLVHQLREREPKPLVHIVKPGDSFYSILGSFKLEMREITFILDGFKKLDLTTLFPGDSIVIRKNTDNSFRTIDLFKGLQEKYSLTDSDSCLYAEKSELPVSLYTCVVNGFLETSLSEAMYEFGVSDQITAAFADIFAWDINFFLDPRKGDAFQIVLEKKMVDGRFAGYGDILAARYTLGNRKEFNAIGFIDNKNRVRYYDDHGNAVQKQFLKAPLRYSRVSSGFTYKRKHPILGIVRPHLGIDYAAPYGTAVHAAADGKVQFSGNKGDYGKIVILTHGGAFQTYYGHLQSIGRNIHPGLYVKQGDVLGKVGATGLATGPHLDYRMKKGNTFVNPATIITPSVNGVPEEDRARFFAEVEYYRALFETRFTNQPGCHLVDIRVPDPVEPGGIYISKINLPGKGEKSFESNG